MKYAVSCNITSVAILERRFARARRCVAVSQKRYCRCAAFPGRYARIYFALPRQYSGFQAAKLISRSADSADCTSIVTYIDIPARTRSACVFTHPATRGTWSHIITFIKGASYTSNGNVRFHGARVYLCTCRFSDNTLDRGYILFHFRENRWEARLPEESCRHAWCDN